MKRPKIDDYGIGDGLIDKRKFSKEFEQYCDKLEKEKEELRRLLEIIKHELRFTTYRQLLIAIDEALKQK
jgi:hypothetical protein